MDKQIKRYTPSDSELEGFDLLITKIPELQEIIKNEDYILEKILNATDNLKSVDKQDILLNNFL